MIALLLVLKIMRSRICIQIVLKNALVHDGLARGLRECAKALDKRQAHLCVLVETCSEAEYIKLIEALCADHKINLIKVADPKVLGALPLCSSQRSPLTRSLAPRRNLGWPLQDRQGGQCPESRWLFLSRRKGLWRRLRGHARPPRLL